MNKATAIIILSLYLFLFNFNFIGCSKDFLPSYKNQKNVTLKVLSWIPEPESVLRAFEKRYKNIKIEWLQIDYENYYSQLDESIQDPDKCPDLVFVELPLLNYYANQKQLTNLSKMGADLYYKEMFEKWLWNASGRIEVVPIIEGPYCHSCQIPTEPRLQVYGLPYILGPAVLFYDEQFLEDNNLNVPENWNDFEKILEKFSKVSYGKKFLAIPSDPAFLIGFSWGNHEKVLDYFQNRNYFNFDIESLNKLFEYLQILYNEGVLEFLSYDHMLERSNDFVFMIAPQWFIQYLDSFKFTNVPSLGKNLKVFDLDTITLSIPKNSTNPREAFLLAGWLSCSRYSYLYLKKSDLISATNYISLKFKGLNLKNLDGPNISFLYPDILKNFYNEVLNEVTSLKEVDRLPKFLQEKLGNFFNNNKYLLSLPSEGGE
ncbi:ABC-type glycerol-3-phosphate transport system substrate-binding protein [Caldicoprobacter guelmensis]|uniref:ABC transporter substrate-binding protein n=1 Tax=Caldicoprobacter guelmensis TaxID=1170224 RepID=UPI0019576A49|nr:extracellular solute-binding protein [Caldicoprobacter guelmensis]MBM7583354.1 ABC-type glycerol-3-phosphate transport system substrate-binding protein [Caldicoprobacter guelmensis]